MKVIGVLKDVRIHLTVDPQIQDIIDIHVVDIPETYGLLLSREWMKCLRGWFSIDFIQLWFPWRGLNNKIKIDVEPKLKTMIMDYNAPNEIAFMQSELGSYKVMVLDIVSTNTPQDQNKEPKVPIPNTEKVTQFIDSMVTNL